MLGIVTGLELEAELCRKAFVAKGDSLPLIACAAGTVIGAQRAAQQLIDQGANRLISLGVCGGLAPHIQTGDLCLPRKAIMGEQDILADGAWLEKLRAQFPNAVDQAIVSVATAVRTAQEKQALFVKTHAASVDVESFAVLREAEKHGLPAIIIRAVLDPADQALPQSALCGVNDKGETQIWPVIKSLLKRPHDLPDLLRLGQQNKTACAVLSEAIKKAAL